MELTTLCEEIVGKKIDIDQKVETHSVDIPMYISDCRRIQGQIEWRPQRDVRRIVTEIYEWIRQNEADLKTIFS